MIEYIEGMIYLHPKYCIPKNPKEALEYIKEMRKPAINRTIEQMKDSKFYFKMKELDELDEMIKNND